MFHTRTRRAFTLVELLTVMAIIVILIGILTPALSAARTRATKTAVRAQINSLSVGLEAFRNDQGEYIASNSVLLPPGGQIEMDEWEVGAIGELNGAHLLVDAMVGRDLLGYDPRAPREGQTNYDRWAVTNDRRDPYIPVDGIDVTSQDQPAEDSDGIIPTTTFPKPNGTEVVGVPVFRDKFGWPILYYRASLTATQNTPIIQTTTGLLASDGVYDGLDNALFTSYGMSNHRIADANGSLPNMCDTGYGTDDLSATFADGGTFAEFIRSFRATTVDPMNPLQILCPRPVKADSFIILSAGRDGLYGTLDDVANFEVFSTER